ncbi:MAG: nucleoside-diphosphate kinase [Lactovum sp.]
MEKTFIFIKPDVFNRGLEIEVDQEIKAIAHQYKLEVERDYIGVLSHEFLAYHYAVHLDKPFYEELIEELENKSFHAYILTGEDAVNIGLNRIKMIIRGKYAIDKVFNSIHSSDQLRTANYEINNFNQHYPK